jgi:hypothetical protein
MIDARLGRHDERAARAACGQQEQGADEQKKMAHVLNSQSDQQCYTGFIAHKRAPVA